MATTSRAYLPSGLELATIGRRTFAAIIDAAIIGTGLWFPVFRLWGEYDEAAGKYEVKGIPAIALFGLSVAYFLLLEWLWAGTLGKRLLDMQVVSLKGIRCSFTQSLKCNMLRPLDFIFFYLVGFIAAKLSPLGQRLGDQWAGTVVVLRKQDAFSGRDCRSDEHMN